jgi:thiamine pyrophosphate-dependent acetolactate synthase large subunit-like protein
MPASPGSVPVTVVLGEEELLAERAVADATATAVGRLGPGTTVEEVRGAAPPDGFAMGLATASLFGGGRVVVVQEAEALDGPARAAVLALAADPSPATAVVLRAVAPGRQAKFFKDVQRHAAVVQVAKLRPSERASWLRAEVRRLGRKADEAAVAALVDTVGQDLRELAGAVAGNLGLVLDGLVEAATRLPGPAAGRHRQGNQNPWLRRLREEAAAAAERDRALLESDADPIHPARVYGELRRLLADDAVVVGDGGDFVSFAGRYLEPARPGGWLDPGPYGCLGTGLGYAIAARLARPDAQVVLLLGDGAAGFSLMDVDTLVRHRLPVVIVCGNNGVWGLEKHPMRMLYGYDVAADLQPGCRYDEVARALGGAGELVTSPSGIGPALRRAFDAGVPYLVNVATDPEVAYPRSTTGI